MTPIGLDADQRALVDFAHAVIEALRQLVETLEDQQREEAS